MSITPAPEQSPQALGDPAFATALPDDAERGVEGARKGILLASLLITNLVLFACYAGIVAILLPQQIALIDPENKVASFAAVTSISAFATLFVQPIVGALSDRTRSRLGRRSPWIVFGGIGGGICILALQFGTTVGLLAFLWVAAQVALNALNGPLSAVLADRVKATERGMASGVVGMGTAIGGAAGIAFAGLLLTQLGIAYNVLGGGIIVAAVLFVLLNPDRSTAEAPREPFRFGAFLRGFWINPRKHPDYAWAFAGRFFMVLGFQAVNNYMFYILTDYIGLEPQDAGSLYAMTATITAVATVASTVVVGKLSDVLGRRKIFVFAASLLLAAAIAVPLIWPSTTGVIAYAVLAGIGYGAYLSVDLALMIDVLPSRGDMAKDLGVLNVASNLPQTIVPVIAALLLGAFANNYAVIFIYGIIAVVASSFLVLPIKAVR